LHGLQLDRLTPSPKDLQDNVRELKERRVALRATEQPIDTGTAASKAFLDILGVFAELETNLRKEPQAEGIATAKGRKSKINCNCCGGITYKFCARVEMMSSVAD
jgi:DNA invertase Pin-like site-specific DNA recombinase